MDRKYWENIAEKKDFGFLTMRLWDLILANNIKNIRQLKQKIVSGKLSNVRTCRKRQFKDACELVNLDPRDYWIRSKYSKQFIEKSIRVLRELGYTVKKKA